MGGTGSSPAEVKFQSAGVVTDPLCTARADHTSWEGRSRTVSTVTCPSLVPLGSGASSGSLPLVRLTSTAPVRPVTRPGVCGTILPEALFVVRTPKGGNSVSSVTAKEVFWTVPGNHRRWDPSRECPCVSDEERPCGDGSFLEGRSCPPS